MELLPAAGSGTVLRILATSDLGAAFAPLPTSFGQSGTCAGIVELLEREREHQPTIWLDAGDLAVGSPAYPLLGRRPWEEVGELPIAAAAAGNHEFDDGVPALMEATRSLSFPMLCANADVGLPGSAMVDGPAGPLGVIGLTNPHIDRFSLGPPLAEDWPGRVGVLARELRGQGARWVVALLHDGVEWWPSGDPGGSPIRTRSDRLITLARPWATHVDLVLCGHNLCGWVGELDGTPAGHAFVYANSVLVVDVPRPPAQPVVRGCFPVPAVRPARPSPTVEATDAAAARVVGESSETWLTRTGARRYLPNLLASSLRTATGAEAALILPGFHSTQAPLDGAVAALRAGPVTELDLVRIFDDASDRPVIVELRPGEFRSAVDAYEAISNPLARDGDRVWWNWCRMPAGTSAAVDDPKTVAVMPPVASRHLGEWLGRDVVYESADAGARDALAQALG
jgi:hypothetical protein